MKAICVTAARSLEVRDVPAPEMPVAGHVLVDIAACAINQGDKTFLKMPDAAGRLLPAGAHDVWGASGAGTVVAVGAGVPDALIGRKVAIYRSLRRSPDTVGLWCERAQVPRACCVVLPPHVDLAAYSGSLVNAITAYSFLREARANGHRAVIATAGRSATALALAALSALSASQDMPVILLTRGTEATPIPELPMAHVLATGSEGFTDALQALANELGATAVFDGVGGALLGRILGALPQNATVSCYGFLGGNEPLAFPTALLMQKNLTLTRFSNFESSTVADPARLDAVLTELASLIDNPALATRIGRTFGPDQIDDAMAFESGHGAKAVLHFGG